jgi:hypothetical protein
MVAIATIRQGIFCVAIVFSLIVLGIDANFATMTMGLFSGASLGIATAVMTLLFVGANFILTAMGKASFITLVWVELACTGLIWILWVSTAGSISTFGFIGSCGGYLSGEYESVCRQFQAAQAFSWLSWLMWFGWYITLLVLSIMSASRGDSRVWFASVPEYQFGKQQGGEKSNNYGSQASMSPGQAYPPAQPQVYGQPQPYGQQLQPNQQQYGHPQQPYSNTMPV